VASPPCQRYSYMAMPWSRAKAMAARYRDNIGDLNDLFNTCFRIQREASEAAGRYIPLVVENVNGAQPWVGPAAWHYGSFYLWGDVPALMPEAGILCGRKEHAIRRTNEGNVISTDLDCDNGGISVWRGAGANGRLLSPVGENVPPAFRSELFGWKKDTPLRNNNSKSSARKAASAQIAKIPFPLAQWIARVYKPHQAAEATA